MANETEPRALGAALSAPAFVTRGNAVAMHAATRHVERWAPEQTAGRVRSMRSLGFVDRLVAPWMETAQRSASMRLLNQYASSGPGEREAGAVSWVFPRPWYQDELDWMAAARQTTAESQRAAQRQVAPSLLTTRGTYVAPSSTPSNSSSGPSVVMPSALYEYVAPSLSIAASGAARRQVAGVGHGGETLASREAYSPLVSLAAVQAAELMSRTIAPLAMQRRGAGATTAMTPGLRSVLTNILERASAARIDEPTRLSLSAPELVTPPAPRPSELPGALPLARAAVGETSLLSTSGSSQATLQAAATAAASAARVAEQYAEQRARILDLQRIAQHSAQRELAERAETTARTQAADAASAAASTASASASASASRQAADARATSIAQATAAATTAQQNAQRTVAQNAAAAQAAQAAQSSQSGEVRAATERAEAELRQRSGEARNVDLQRQAQAAALRATEAQRQAETAAGTARVEAQRQADVARAEAQRLADAASSTASNRAAIAQRQADATSAAERARIEERIAQGMSQQATARSSAQRLHEQARSEAAVHARATFDAQSRATGVAVPTPVAAYQPTAEVAAAIASLPPELAAMLGATASQRPERTVQAIGELNDTLRTAELLARNTASGAGFQVTRGPRMMMPAGLGGLVSAVDRAQSISSRPMLGGVRQIAPLAQFVAPQQISSSATQDAAAAVAAGAPAMTYTQASMRAGRVPSLPWLASSPAVASAIAPTSALGATASASPAALTHVAWADRWLARFAGANPQSLNLMTASAGSAPEVRMQALASIAPGAVFVAPDFLRGARGDELMPESASRSARLVALQQAQSDAQARVAALAQAGVAMSPADLTRLEAARSSSTSGSTAGSTATHVVTGPAASADAGPVTLGQLAAAARPDMQLISPPAEQARRFDDNEETPDDVFAAISAAASRGRGAPRPISSSVAAQLAQAQAAAQQARAALEAAQQGPQAGTVDRQTYADFVAHAAPNAPGAGLSAQLASSPFAPALRHVLPLPSAASFDVRSLFGSGLGATYLAGLVGAAPRELEVGAQLPTWASWDLAPLAQLGQLRATGGFADSDDRIDRVIPGFDAAYVTATDDVPRADALSSDARAALEAQLAAGASPESLGAANLAALRAAQVAQAQAQAGSSAQGSTTAQGYPTAQGSDAASDFALSSSQTAAAAAAAAMVPAATLTTLRSALLSWGLTISEDAVIGQAAGGAGAGSLGSLGAAELGQPAYQHLAQFAPTTFVTPPARGGLHSMGTARTMLDVMAMPMLGDVDSAPSQAWSAPGMIAERAHSFSIAQERSSSDLALDFVTPELVLAARVYGLGPAEAAQAARLAIVGPGQLGAMASAVDRTFVDAMAIVRDNRNSDDRRQRSALSAALSGEGGMFASAARDFVSPSAAGVAGSSSATGATGASQAAPSSAAVAQAAQLAQLAGQSPEQLVATLTAQGATAADVRAAIATAFPTADGSIATAIAPTTRAPAAQAEVFGNQSHPSFGVARRSPRGAFLWPQATVAALGMHAAGSDGQLSMSVAALELLAAQVVAEVGTYAALSEADTGARISAGEASSDEVATAASAAASSSAAAAASPTSTAASSPMTAAIAAAIAAGVDPVTAAARAAQLVAGAPVVSARATQSGAPSLFSQPGGGEPAESDVLGAAAQLVPAARRARFDALYVALSQSPAGRSWSPAARAARALALAGRSDDTTVTARERAATAWDVLPVVYPSEAAAAIAPAAQGSDGELETAASAAAAAMSSYVSPSSAPGAGTVDATGAGSWSPQGAAQRASRRHGAARGPGSSTSQYAAVDGFDGESSYVSPSSGLSGLSARAGNALGAYVAPVAPPSAPSGSSSPVNSVGAMMRAPTAMPEYVQTGRPAGRYGGGEVEIPQWFEAAARKMFADKSGDSGDGISLAELTLVSSAPQHHIAASSRVATSSAPPAPGGGAPIGQQNALQIDVEKLAHDIYRQILVMMDAARARNGDPYQ